jgi:3-(3-hydroxy-phenyl)propionate hydroxylase
VSSTTTEVAPVLVVGAGPSGVTAALLLAQHGIEVLVLDRWAGVYPRPRAVHLDDEVYRILARLGLAEQFAQISRPAHGLRLQDAKHRVFAEFRRHEVQVGTAFRRPTCSTSPTSRRCCGPTCASSR